MSTLMSLRKYLSNWGHVRTVGEWLRKYVLNWGCVRTVGASQILTRVSGVMLVVVPLLAGVWPIVRTVIIGHNEILAASTREFGDTAQKLDAAAQKLGDVARLVQATTRERAIGFQGSPVVVRHAQGGDSIVAEFASDIQKMSQIVRNELTTLKRQAVLSPSLPPSWALAFFGALAVTIGHAIYQGFAPQITKRDSIDEFVHRRRTEYREHPSSHNLSGALARIHDTQAGRERRRNLEASQRIAFGIAQAALEGQPGSTAAGGGAPHREMQEKQWESFKEVYSEILGALEKYLKNLSSYEAEIVYSTFTQFRSKFIPTDWTLFEGVFKHAFPPNEQFGVSSTDGKDNRKLELIEEAARIEYSEASRSNSAAMSVCLIFYGLGFAIVAYITAQQSYRVADVAGWFGP